MDSLTAKRCVPCEIGSPPIPKKQAEQLLKQVPGWELMENKIERSFKFADFKQAIRFVNSVADVAEDEGHHPDINIVYNKVKLTLFTHTAKGLTENDFILAAKINILNPQ